MTPVVQSWPTAVDYQMALQAPELCFKEERLQNAEVKVTPLGLPMAATGNVVVVFRLTLPDGQEVALRCFTRKQTLDGMALRYERLNQHFSDRPLSVLVPSEFMMDAVMVEGEWYPASLMPWVKGRQLHLFMEDHLDEPEALRAAAEHWRKLMEQLRTAEFAHGDLSDGNVLVDDECGIRLIDFDAAYIPSLKHAAPSEIGKPNYQHPDRLRSDAAQYGYYAPNVDAFAALVIYLSLRAVAADASLWDRYNMGDNLIFVQKDYENPGATPIWAHLRASKDSEVRRLSDVLERYCKSPLPDLPWLEDALQGNSTQVAEPVPAPPLQQPAAQPPVIQVPKATTYRHDSDLDPTVMIRRPAAFAPTTGSMPLPLGPVMPAPPRPPNPFTRAPSRWRGVAFGMIGLVLVLAVGAAVMWRPWEPATSTIQVAGEVATTAQQPPRATPEVVALKSSDLTGFYTGYTTLPDGTREALGLTIDPANPGASDGRFPFSFNSRMYQFDGTGAFDEQTGIVDLENQYLLFAERTTRGEIVLTALPKGAPNPLMQVRRAPD